MTTDIILKATVASLESGNSFTDHQERMTLRIEGCDTPSDRIRLARPMFHGLMLDDEYEVILRPVVKQEAGT